MSDQDRFFEDLVGSDVVLDMTGPYVFAGKLVSCDDRFFVLENVDVHDLRDTATTRELYVVELKRHGIRPSRKRVLVRKDEVVSLSAFDDILD